MTTGATAGQAKDRALQSGAKAAAGCCGANRQSGGPSKGELVEECGASAEEAKRGDFMLQFLLKRKNEKMAAERLIDDRWDSLM
ncbi:hypothetical protein Q1695_006892 [Nippostrongylus brasiliensis]|nr:hypothetical protein Q1695_006892 [Nippostrongylus brasiliensis]